MLLFLDLHRGQSKGCRNERRNWSQWCCTHVDIHHSLCNYTYIFVQLIEQHINTHLHVLVSRPWSKAIENYILHYSVCMNATNLAVYRRPRAFMQAMLTHERGILPALVKMMTTEWSVRSWVNLWCDVVGGIYHCFVLDTVEVHCCLL